MIKEEHISFVVFVAGSLNSSAKLMIDLLDYEKLKYNIVSDMMRILPNGKRISCERTIVVPDTEENVEIYNIYDLVSFIKKHKLKTTI